MPMFVSFVFALLTTTAQQNREEGFVIVGSDTDVKVAHLHDEGTGGERPPSWMLQVAGGLFHVDFLATSPGGTLQTGLFWRFSGDWWVGTRLDGAIAGRPHDQPVVKTADVAIEVQHYFVLHSEANRFVMGHIHTGVGAIVFDTKEKMAGPFTSLGIGVGVALSFDRYLGVRVSYAIPFWVHNDTQPKEYASFLLISLFFTKGF